jgi:hypothetical protein
MTLYALYRVDLHVNNSVKCRSEMLPIVSKKPTDILTSLWDTLGSDYTCFLGRGAEVIFAKKVILRSYGNMNLYDLLVGHFSRGLG